ncbi:hypothetical protein [Nocardia sp. NPDC006630]|uniref:hypothetical protein n=1 Tax=Nocardia sp. NPDC006630 TaxID=3157181 RepID=UPI0033ACB207
MGRRMNRRSMLAVGALAGLVPVLDACGGKGKHPKAVAPTTPAPLTGPGADIVMIIRHGEKPEGSGSPYGITADGDHDAESLTVRGWTRAGALIGLFDPRTADGKPAAFRPGLSRPATIFGADPGSGGSKRPVETVTPLAEALGLTVDQRFKKGQEAQLAAGLAHATGPVLLSWEHENIGEIIAHLGPISPNPPASWPGSRFDMVYVFTRAGNGWAFTQVPQLLLSGDAPTPFG